MKKVRRRNMHEWLWKFFFARTNHLGFRFVVIKHYISFTWQKSHFLKLGIRSWDKPLTKKRSMNGMIFMTTQIVNLLPYGTFSTKIDYKCKQHLIITECYVPHICNWLSFTMIYWIKICGYCYYIWRI